MSTVNQDELKAIKVLKFTGKESEWDHWSEMFVALARARGFAGIFLSTEQAPNADKETDRKKTDGIMQDNCQFGDMLKDEKRKSLFKYELGRLMGEYAVPLPLRNFSLNNKETRRLELWKNRRGMWFDHVDHMEEGPEQNKEWEKFWWTVDENMFTYVIKTKIEELIEEKLNQEFPEEVEIREDTDYDSEEEVTSETEETDDDESETNNANVNNYLDSANIATSLETAMKIAEEEDLWIGDSGASSHMMGSEEHVFNKKLITGSVRTANSAHMKMLCEGDINVDVITKNGDVTSGTLRVKAIPGMKQKLLSFTQAMMGGWWPNKTRRAFHSSNP